MSLIFLQSIREGLESRYFDHSFFGARPMSAEVVGQLNQDLVEKYFPREYFSSLNAKFKTVPILYLPRNH